MSEADFLLHGIRDPQLAGLATSVAPAWVWSLDGGRVLWANTAGARLFGARNAAVLAQKTMSAADPHRRQAAQLASRLSTSGAVRLERLRGFGAPLGRLLTCSCALLTFVDGTTAILIAAMEPVGRPIPLTERLAALVDSVTTPAITFTPDGALAGANEAAKAFAGVFNDLTGAGFDEARKTALRDGQSAFQMDIGRVTLHRVGSGSETALVALIGAAIIPKPVPKPAPVLVAAPIIAAPVEAAPEILQPLPIQPADVAEPAQTAQVKEPVTTAEPHDVAAFPETSPADMTLADVFESVFDEPHSFTDEKQHVPEPQTPVQDTLPATASPEHHDAPEHAAPQPIAETIERHDEHAITTEPTDHITRIYIGDDRPASTPRAPDADEAPAAASVTNKSPLPQSPLRFAWQMDDEARFSLGSDDFTRLIGSRTAAAFGRTWHDIAVTFGLDRDGRVAAAIATRQTWSGIAINWPTDGGGTLPVELSGFPIHDIKGGFLGYRGFGICRDVEAMTQLAAQHRDTAPESVTPSSEHTSPQDATLQDEPAVQDNRATSVVIAPVVIAPSDEMPAVGDTPDKTPSNHFPETNFAQAESKPAVDILQNVVPFPVAETKSPALTPVESNAFDELARRLSARLENSDGASDDVSEADLLFDDAGPQTPDPLNEARASEYPPVFPQREPAAPRANSLQDTLLLDRLPVGVLVYRLDRLIYANSAFLASTGYDSLHALTEAGGLDALTVESGAGSASSTSENGTPVVIAATSESGPDKGQPADARLFAITWDGEPAHALVFSGPRAEPRPEPVAPTAIIAPVASPTEDTTQAEELATILDATAEGIVIFDGEGRLVSCNRSAETLFGRTDSEIAALHISDLFAPESQRAALDYLESVKTTSVASLLDHGREMLGRLRDGGVFPLSMTVGRTRPDSMRFFAVFRDLSQAKKSESELMQLRRQAERGVVAKADILGRISHEVRMPLNAIIGFSDVMIEERFGALGNERYVEYMKDIRASGQRVMAIIDDLLDLSRIESGKMELSFASQDLNSMVEQCVAVMQPQANRERIIIRTSLAHALPTVKADARALRQIALNLIGNSIHLANAGGQVIVSTATTDFGDIVLRVRDTGAGLNDNEIAAAMAPFRAQGVPDQTADGSVVNLSLTKALVEANRAQFHIKTAPHSGTLIEVVFSHASAIA